MTRVIRADESEDLKRAIYFANRALDKPSEDPDDDLRTVSRQLLRTLDALNAALARVPAEGAAQGLFEDLRDLAGEMRLYGRQVLAHNDETREEVCNLYAEKLEALRQTYFSALTTRPVGAAGGEELRALVEKWPHVKYRNQLGQETVCIPAECKRCQVEAALSRIGTAPDAGEVRRLALEEVEEYLTGLIQNRPELRKFLRACIKAIHHLPPKRALVAAPASPASEPKESK